METGREAIQNAKIISTEEAVQKIYQFNKDNFVVNSHYVSIDMVRLPSRDYIICKESYPRVIFFT